MAEGKGQTAEGGGQTEDGGEKGHHSLPTLLRSFGHIRRLILILIFFFLLS